MSEILSHHALAVGTMVQEYRLTRILGIGGFGIVYAAENIYLDETVAIKEFLPAGLATRIEKTQIAPLSQDKEEVYNWALKNFLKEAKILWELSRPKPHRSIVRVTRFHEENGTAYMVMDYEEGQALSSILKKSATLPEAQINAILHPLLDGLQKVHEASIWHRDIKPDNILVRSDGSPVLIDFGAAHRDMIGGEQSLMAVFSPAYGAPEQVFRNAKQGPWTDIYAFGATLYRATTGVVPPSVAERYKDAEYSPASELAIDQYSPSLLNAIDAALVLAPEARPQSIRDWRKLMEPEAQDSEAGIARTVLASTPTVPRKSRLSSGDAAAEPTVSSPAVGAQAVSGVDDNAEKRSGVLPGLGMGATALLALGGLFFVFQPPPDEAEDRNTIISRIQNTLDSYECSYVEPSLDQDLQLQLSGFVKDKNDLQRLDKDMRSNEGITGIENDVKVVVWPFCEMAALLARRQPPDLAPDQQVRISMNESSLTYKEGELLVVTANSSNAFDGYLYIDHLDRAGDVVHMFPSPLRPDNRVTAGQQIVVGTEDQSNDLQQRAYQVLPPHGQNMIVVIYSSEPLYDGERMEVEPAADYFSSLRNGLNKLASAEQQAELTSTYTFITTRE